MDFSPRERYLVTWSNEPIAVPEGALQGPQYFSPVDEGNNIAMWDIASGDLLHTFPTKSGDEGSSPKKAMQWPVLKWSPDDKFVARVTPGQHISVFELPSMVLRGNKSLEVERVIDFEWEKKIERTPKRKLNRIKQASRYRNKQQNMLAYLTPEDGNQPTRVTLINFPTRSILRQKNLFNVTEVGSTFEGFFPSIDKRIAV
jgi:translation initiation factor 3 subunit B